MIRRASIGLCLLAVAACQQAAPAPAKEEPQPTAKLSAPAVESAPPAVAERKFGTPLRTDAQPVAVEDVLASPEPYLGKVVQCSGTVARVCQAAGCWLELQASSGGEGLRVPMAAHAFFIPQDAVGHVAVVEGELKRRELVDTQRKHYEGEGMKAVGPLSLDATGVVIR